MPVGPSYRLRWRSKRDISSPSVAVPITCTGPVWATSANNAPSVSTIPAPWCRAMPSNCSTNSRQRNAGSGPSTKMTSPPGVAALHTPTVGQTMVRV